MKRPPTPKPWLRSNPKPRPARSGLTPAQVEEARARAEAAGRRYPNLVDNMWAAGKARQGREAAKRPGATPAGPDQPDDEGQDGD
ncbi:hypothetical protein [Lysobacter sp. A3-1-A15]|uniref:hypothetical protein n=1 Tax=Novilysobacter viscosus TaxID=3098602 RepID=UPI002ED9285C